MGEQVVFYSLASIIAFCGLMVVTRRNPVTAAVFLVFTLFFMAGLYALLGAEFIAAIQVILYAGAILVLFMFVIMLLNLDPESLKTHLRRSPMEWLTLVLLTLGGGLLLVFGLFSRDLSRQLQRTPLPADGDNTFAVGMQLFTRSLWPFELASMLILLAVIASVMIAKKTKAPPKAQLKQAMSKASQGGQSGTH